MKSYLIIMVLAVSMLPFTGCKKKSFDPTGKSREDFIGTWKGSISTFKNNKLLNEYGTIVIYPDAGGSSVSGILFMKETNVFHEFQFVDGTLYFHVENTDPTSPLCQNWNLGGFIVFKAEGELDIRITGNECGQIGNEFVNWVGTLFSDPVSADSIKYYNFAKTGNSWTYNVKVKNGDSCQVQKQVSQASGNYIFTGHTTQTCGWPGQTMTFRWEVNPAGFTLIVDSTLADKPLLFAINAKPGVVYASYSNNDTTTVTLLDSSLVETTPAGTFECSRFRYTEPVYSGQMKTTRTSYIWLSNRYGVIRHEVINPVDSTDVIFQLLTSKNF